MPQQSYTVGTEPAYAALPRTTRAPGNAAQAPKTIELASGTLHAQVECELVGRYDRSGAVSEVENFRLKHDIPGDRAALEVQRFVKAVKIQATEIVCTSGAGYLRWGATSQVPAGRGLQALCASQLRAAGLQDDGPRGSGKVFEIKGGMGLEIRDSPGMAASSSAAFPYALLADFIMRVIVRPAKGETEVAEFRYQTYFELASDPYPRGMREATFVPQLSGYNDQQSFTNILQRFQQDQQRNQLPQAVPVVRRQRVTATTDDVGQVVKKKNYNDMI